MTAQTDPLAPHRERLLGLAYRMLGSFADAEDVLQDTFIRLRAAPAAPVANPEAYLVTTVTRLCLDRLKSARCRRETYIGPWLPEPVLDGEALSAGTTAELAQDLSFALLLLLDRLSPPERAAFLLHDVFDLPFTEIADILDRSQPACRQLASRARKTIHAGRPGHAPSACRTPIDQQSRLLHAFGTAIATGDIAALTNLLRKDAVLVSDGGGAKPAARNPISGADRIARFLIGLARKPTAAALHSEPRMVNGALGVVNFVGNDLEQVISMVADGDRIAAIYIVRNPQKLVHLASQTRRF
jgi:RNA polymerase sigma-70 factor (ECF subfamily)